MVLAKLGTFALYLLRFSMDLAGQEEDVAEESNLNESQNRFGLAHGLGGLGP